MKHIILGTAGHVDHGKTALIKALTDVDTDRLKEEKERGITIELGFAPLVLEKGQKIGIVDVPGHERFVKNMVAGAGGIDLVVLIIAADEGIMPQTREHLDICELLGIHYGLVALTKTDLVDDDWLTLVTEEVEDFLSGTFLEDAPIIPLSSVTGEGLTNFRSALQTVITSVEERPDSGHFRLPVDRIFTMRGFGTVVTGSLVSGKITTGEAVEIMPSKIRAKIRGIQIHNEQAETVEAGNRTAINLQGIEKSAIKRGDVITRPDDFETSQRLDVFFRYLSSAKKKMKNRALVRFHTGTAEIISRIILLDRDEIEPGDTAYAQVVLEHPTVTEAGDRFVIRSYSPISTIGGGEILDPLTRKIKRSSEAGRSELERLRLGTEKEKTDCILERAGLAGISARQLSTRTGIPPKDQDRILSEMLSKREALLLDKDERRVVASSQCKNLQKEIVTALTRYHERFPLREWSGKEELKNALGTFIEPRLFNRVLKDLENEGKIVSEKEHLRISGHRVIMKAGMETLKEKALGIYEKAGLAPPSIKEVMESFKENREDVKSVLAMLVGEEALIKVSEELYFHGESMDKLRNNYKNFLIEEGKATPASFRDLTGLSRKYTIPLMEYFDKTKLTIRVGDHRVLREGETA
jgi:selenocysteine-specific elongation factor